MKKILFASFITATALIAFFSCTKEKAKLQGPTDAQMYAWAIQNTDRFYYQNDSVTIISPAAAQQNFHGPFKERFNALVKNKLGGDGRLAPNTTLPDSSIIVKVTYTGNVINGYSVIFKLNQAWCWGWYDAAGGVIQSVKSDASLCLSCHNGTGNRDQVLTFTYH